jgi:hypothetical protein
VRKFGNRTIELDEVLNVVTKLERSSSVRERGFFRRYISKRHYCGERGEPT